MPYLILHDGTPRCAGRCSEASFTLPRMRAAVERAFPGRTVKSPLDHFTPGDATVNVYLSPVKTGYGRVNKFFTWLVGPVQK